MMVEKRQSPRRAAKPVDERSGAPRAATAVIGGRIGLLRPTTPALGLTTMTDDKIAFRQMLEKDSDATFLREMDTSDNCQRCSGWGC